MPRNTPSNAAANVPAIPAGFAGTSLATMDLNRFRTALQTAEQNVDTGTGKQFLRMNRAGVWQFGSNATEIEVDAEFAVNPMSLEQGYIAWGAGGGKPLGQLMRSIMAPPVQQSELPHVAAEWTQNVGVCMRCLNGEDAGIEFEFTSNSVGGKNAWAELVGLFKAQLDLDATRIIPVIRLTSESYRHTTYGTIFNPIFEVVRWLSEEELPELPDTPAQPPAPAAATTAAAASQPEPAPTPTPAGRGRGRAAAPAAAAAPTTAAAAPAATGTRRRRAA